MVSNYSILEEKINNLLAKHGAEVIISYLADFDRNFDESDYEFYKELLTIVCEVYDRSEMELFKATDTQTTNARRIIAYYLHTGTKFKSKTNWQIMGIAKRTYYNYINNVQDRLEFKKSFRQFNQKYVMITEKMNVYKEQIANSNG